jgi:hypothetical protein
LYEVLKDKDVEVREIAEKVLAELCGEEDLTWLAEAASRYPPGEMEERAKRILLGLDRRFYFPVAVIRQQ